MTLELLYPTVSQMAAMGVLAQQSQQSRQDLLALQGNQQRAAMQNVTSTVYSPATDQYLQRPVLQQLNAVPQMVDQTQAFVARQLVAQAQADYVRALERGTKAEAEEHRLRGIVAVHKQRAEAADAKVLDLESKLRALQPVARARVVSPLFAQVRRTDGRELRWPWLAVSWALIAAGAVVCVL